PGQGQPGQGQPGQGQPGQGQPGQGQSSNDPLGQSAESLRQAAEALAQAAQGLQPGGQPGQDGQNQASGRREPAGQSPGGSRPPLAADSATGDGGGVGETGVDLARLESEIARLTHRQWGQLPGNLQTDIVQAASRKPNGDYAQLIKLYFREIAETGKPAEGGRP
ncbi:MAG: hypothetical protein WD069_22625, partial [Planctomycetales bacterium]